MAGSWRRESSLAVSAFVSPLMLAICLAVVVAAGPLARVTLHAAAGVAVNSLVPDLTLPDAGGAVHHLADFKGQVVLLDFWASWCIPCKASFPQLDALYKELKDKGATVLAINLDEQRKAADTFLATRPHTMPVLFDAAGKVAATFNLQGMPSSVLVDRQGKVRFVHMGYTEKTLAQYRSEIAQLLAEQH
jgi:thiol-disulfide isomerase/thioredoxin